MIGHTNRVNALESANTFIYSSANDCTVRQWDTQNGTCVNIFKFSDPISVCKVKAEDNFLFTASWDKMIRVVCLEKRIVLKAFIASKETIKEMCFSNEMLIVAGCDPLIRGYHLETGAVKLFHGHKGWIYCLMIYNGYLYSGGDDNVVRIWDCNTGSQVEQLIGHRNGVT
jgi:WD40 repeat protein